MIHGNDRILARVVASQTRTYLIVLAWLPNGNSLQTAFRRYANVSFALGWVSEAIVVMAVTLCCKASTWAGRASMLSLAANCSCGYVSASKALLKREYVSVHFALYLYAKKPKIVML